MSEVLCSKCEDERHDFCSGITEYGGAEQCECSCNRIEFGGDGSGQAVDRSSAAKAIAAFAELWGNALFDCGPQDYKRFEYKSQARNR
jgi:hypothetical protein